MSRIAAKPPSRPKFRTAADLFHRLGDIPAERVCMDPPPGTATVRDLVRCSTRDDTRYELIEGTLVEKAMGYRESEMALDVAFAIKSYLVGNPLGILTGEAGLMKLMRGLVRAPDLAFVAWESLPNRERPTAPVPDLGPDLAVEVLSRGNTAREMERKLKEYFLSGAKLVWIIDPEKAMVRVYQSPDKMVTLIAADTLAGDPVLPGFRFPLGPFFATFGLPAKRKAKRRK